MRKSQAGFFGPKCLTYNGFYDLLGSSRRLIYAYIMTSDTFKALPNGLSPFSPHGKEVLKEIFEGESVAQKFENEQLFMAAMQEFSAHMRAHCQRVGILNSCDIRDIVDSEDFYSQRTLDAMSRNYARLSGPSLEHVNGVDMLLAKIMSISKGFQELSPLLIGEELNRDEIISKTSGLIKKYMTPLEFIELFRHLKKSYLFNPNSLEIVKECMIKEAEKKGFEILDCDGDLRLDISQEAFLAEVSSYALKFVCSNYLNDCDYDEGKLIAYNDVAEIVLNKIIEALDLGHYKNFWKKQDNIGEAQKVIATKLRDISGGIVVGWENFLDKFLNYLAQNAQLDQVLDQDSADEVKGGDIMFDMIRGLNHHRQRAYLAQRATRSSQDHYDDQKRIDKIFRIVRKLSEFLNIEFF